MIYARQSDMVTRYGERELIALTDRDDSGDINAVQLGRALDDAMATVNGFVGRRYALPLLGCAKPVTTPGAPVEYVAPPVLTRITCDLARYYLYTDLADDHEVARRHKAVMLELKAIADSAVELVCPWGGSPGTALANEAGVGDTDVLYSFAPRQINAGSLHGYS